MCPAKPHLSEYEIGKYICPNTSRPIALMGLRPLASVEWPMVVEQCPDCQQKHVLQREEVLHPPIFGYE